MSVHITPMEAISAELLDMQTFLELPFDDSNGQSIVDRANNLEQIIARSGKLCADAGYHRDDFMSGTITATIKEALNEAKWPTTVITKKVEAMCRDYNYMVKWSERVNRSATHAHQFCITLISKMKAEMQLSRNY